MWRLKELSSFRLGCCVFSYKFLMPVKIVGGEDNMKQSRTSGKAISSPNLPFKATDVLCHVG